MEMSAAETKAASRFNGTSFGEWLRAWRASRRLSLSQAAERAGLSRSTLQRWESGVHQPRLAELEALLDALGATPEQRDEALYRIAAPRAAQRLSEQGPVLPDEGVLRPPGGGDLLKAMRLRRRLTQEQVAVHLRVPASTVSRWERSDLLLPDDRMEELFDLLEVHEEERTLLAGGRMLLIPSAPADASPDGLREIAHTICELGDCFRQRPEDPLIDLRYLSLQARIWPHLDRDPGMRDVFACACAVYANYLLAHGRYEEAARQAARALDLGRIDSTPQVWWVWASEYLARAAVESERRPAPGRAVEILQRWSWVPDVLPGELRGGLATYLQRHCGLYLARTGRFEAARQMVGRAREAAERIGSSGEAHGCRFYEASILIQASQPRDALALLPPPRTLESDDVEPWEVAKEHLVWAEALLAAGDRADAQQFLDAATRIGPVCDLAPLRHRIDSLAQRLDEMERGFEIARMLVERMHRLREDTDRPHNAGNADPPHHDDADPPHAVPSVMST